jgi:Mg2+ and Co2+ transporter CorA
LHFPIIKRNHSEEKGKSQEIDFIIGKNFIITTRFDLIDPLHEFSKIFEVNSILDKSHLGDHAGFIFYHMIKRMYHSTVDELIYVRDSLKRIETGIFSNKERDMVFELSKVARELLNFKNTLSLHQEVLESFEIAGRQFFKGDFDYYLRSITGEYCKIHTLIQGETECVAELRETNNSMLTTKQSDIITKLTAISFITLPIGLAIALFEINAKSMPIVGMPGDFWILLLLFILIGIGLFSWMKWKKWL